MRELLNRRMLSIFSLLLIINAVNGSDAQEQYMKALTFISKRYTRTKEDMDKKLENIYTIKKNLKNLKETPENIEDIIYWRRTKEGLETELVNLIKNEAFFYTYQQGLNAILNMDDLDENWNKEERLKKLHDVINSIPSHVYPSDVLDILLDQEEDTYQDEKRAKDALQSVVNDIEASNQE